MCNREWCAVYPDVGDQEGDVGLVWRVVVTVRLEVGVLDDNSFLYLGERRAGIELG